MTILSVGESRPKKFKLGAWLIRLVEQTDHSHSFISWRCPYLDVRKVAEARGSGGRIVINKQFRTDNEVVRIFQYPIPKEKLNELEKWVWHHLRPYGYRHLVGIAVMRLLRYLGFKKAKNHFRDGEYSMICTEMTARSIILATGLNLPSNVEDYGLIEMHDINFLLYRSKHCVLAPDALIKDINNF